MLAIIRRSNAEWRDLIAQWEASGQTQEEWCLAQGINLYTLRNRVRRLRRMDDGGKNVRTKSRDGWIEVKKPDRAAQVERTNENLTEDMPYERGVGEIRVLVGDFTVLVTDGFSELLLARVLSALRVLCEVPKGVKP